MTKPFKPGGKKLSDESPSAHQPGNATGHAVKRLDSFFHSPAGVLLICLLFFGLTVWTFVPALHGDFLRFDDAITLLNQPHVNTGLSWQNVRWALFSTDYSYSFPLTRVSHMMDFTMFGADPWGHHLTNVLFHAANGVLLFLLLKRMTGALWRSLIVAVLFALHPLRVESVAWISERKDVLSTFFALLALWTYTRFAEEAKIKDGRPKRFYGLTLLFFILGLMSKSMLVTFPCLLLLLDYWPLQRFKDRGSGFSVQRLVLEKAPFFLLAVLVCLATYFSVKSVGGQFILHFPLSARLENAVMGYGRYLGLMFWPANLSAIYPYPDHWPTGQLLCATAIFFGMSVLAFAWHRQRPYLLVGWLWYLGTLVPVIGLIPIGGESICTRFTYIPMMGALLLLVWGIGDLSKRWRQRAVVVTAAVMLAAAACVMQTRAEIVYWKDSVTLYNRAIAVTTNNFMAHYCLAIVLEKVNPGEEFNELQKSVAINPDYYDSQLVLGKLFLASGYFSAAIGPLEKAAQLEPQNSWAYHDLGFAFAKMGRTSDSVPFFLKAIELDPHNVGLIGELARALYSSDDPTEAVSNFLATARSDPAGFGHFLEAVQFDTNHTVLINNVAWYFATNPDPKLRNGKYAVRLATRACEMTSFQSHSEVLALAAAYAEDLRFDEAISFAQLACSLAPAAGGPELLKGDRELLGLFRSHQPYHASITASSP